jgi:hypothetical protein
MGGASASYPLRRRALHRGRAGLNLLPLQFALDHLTERPEARHLVAGPGMLLVSLFTCFLWLLWGPPSFSA